MKKFLFPLFCIFVLLISCSNEFSNPEPEPEPSQPQKKEVKVSFGLELPPISEGDAMGLDYPAGVQRITVFEPVAEEDMKFNNHPQLVVFKGKLYVTWVGHPLHETSAESYVYYSYSSDGINWVAPIRIGPGNRASGGWITDGKRLGCLIITGDKVNKTSNTEVLLSEDGLNWSEPQVMLTNAAPSESARRLPNGRYIIVCHGLGRNVLEGVRTTRILYTDSEDFTQGWIEAELPALLPFNENTKEKVARPVEASWYRRKDGILVMLFRDLEFDASKRRWALLYSVSRDNGSTWTQPQETNFPDSDSMQCAGSLFSGKTSYNVNNPVPTRRRVPLTISLSTDGQTFDRIFLLRSTPQPRRYYGISKTEGYSYPGSTVWGEHLFVSYATNKEDIEISRIPLSSLK